MDTVGHQCEQQGLDKRQCQKQVRMILSFMDDKFADKVIQDSARKNCKKSGTDSADKKERNIEREKWSFVFVE